MLSPQRLTRLYPRRWRERYEAEFLATIGTRQLSAQDVIDIVSGAIDAWLSSDVRRVASAHQSIGDHAMSRRTLLVCDPGTVRYTTRDSLIGAGVMLAISGGCALLGIAARRENAPIISDMLMMGAFPGSLVLSMPFWLLKGQPWKAQLATVATTLGLLAIIAYVASIT
jgi:hypothetical protein